MLRLVTARLLLDGRQVRDDQKDVFDVEDAVSLRLDLESVVLEVAEEDALLGSLEDPVGDHHIDGDLFDVAVELDEAAVDEFETLVVAADDLHGLHDLFVRHRGVVLSVDDQERVLELLELLGVRRDALGDVADHADAHVSAVAQEVADPQTHEVVFR